MIEQLQLHGLQVDHAHGDGDKILFLHGAHAGSWYWHNFLPWFAAHGYDAYAMNLRGHHSNQPLPDLGRVTLQDYVNDVKGVIDALGGDVILVGHSMGGVIAQLVAAQMPLRAVVFASTGPVQGVAFKRPKADLRQTLIGLKSLPRLIRRKPLHSSRYANDKLVTQKLAPAERADFYRRLGAESATVALEIMKGQRAAALADLDIPKLVISGVDDGAVLIEMQREIAAQQGAELIELPGHGHVFMLEPGWEVCAQRLATWLRARLGQVEQERHAL